MEEEEDSSKKQEAQAFDLTNINSIFFNLNLTSSCLQQIKSLSRLGE